jgi:hypothetical protein
MSKKNDKRSLQMRNSAAEFLIFQYQTGGDGYEVRVQDGTVWLSQKGIGLIFDTSSDNVGLHLKNIFKSGELEAESVTEEFSVTATDGKNYVVKHYNLDAIIAVGYRVNSGQATAFRRWATNVLRDFALRGYLLDKKRLENGMFFDDDYFERLLEEIREIRLSERRFYQKITDIYATAFDYDSQAKTTLDFFAKAQNKLHYAIHGQTASEVIYERADAEKEHMGLTNWAKAPNGKILKSDVSIAKNYLTGAELEALGMLVNAYLDLAEMLAKQHTPMSMSDWVAYLDDVLRLQRKDILQGSGKIAATLARKYAEGEYDKYRIKQDRLFKSDFDKLLEEADEDGEDLVIRNHRMTESANDTLKGDGDE